MTDKQFISWFRSPVGWLRLTADEDSLTGLEFTDEAHDEPVGGHSKILDRVEMELDAYFAGELKEFTTPIKFTTGSEFQQDVWEALCSIPFGQTISYKQLASKVHNPKAVRAVGSANGQNPIAIIVPCHRVIAHNGRLGGYSGGLDKKMRLLELEKIRWGK